MSHSPLTYVLAVLAGVLAGVINTLAGSGSLITLPVLIFLGLPANVANGTNRVGVLLQNAVGIGTYVRSGKARVTGWAWLVAPAAVGSIAGAQIAVQLNEKVMNAVIGAVMVVMLGTIFIKPEKWLRAESESRGDRPGLAKMVIFFVIGIYGGFIQAGVGVFLLVALVLGAGYSLVDANVIKLVIILALTITAGVVFVVNGQVNWALGGLMAIGQSFGAWLAARFAVGNRNANVWVRRLLIVVLLVSILKLFGLLPI